MNRRAQKPAASDGTRDHEHVGKISTGTTITVLVILAVFFYEIQSVLLPFVLAGLLAFICSPVVEWITLRVRLPRWVAAVGVFVVLMAAAAAGALAGVPPLAQEAAGIISDVEPIATGLFHAILGERTVNLFGQAMNADQLAQAALAGMRGWLAESGRLLTFGTYAFASVFGLFLTAVLLIYFLLGGPEIMRGLLRLLPPDQRPLIRHVWSRLHPVLLRYVAGIVAVVAYAAVAAYIGLGLVLGIPHAVFLALLTALLEMIPVVGPLAAALIAGMVAIRHATGLGAILAYAVYAAALRLSIDQLLGPIALGAAARVHPVLIIFCFLAGGALFGLAGVIMAVPVALTARITLAILYDEPPGGSDPGEAER